MKAFITKKQSTPLGTFLFVLIFASLLALLVNTCQFNKAGASLTEWNAGNIMSDSVMSNYTTMSVNNIQSFLNNKMPVCDTWHEGIYGASGTWYGPPFTCLKDYSENGKSTAQIIYDISQQYHINPQVLIVLLQKEQSLITDTWPAPWQYKTATGFGCPDTAVCDSQYYGFTNQLDKAANLFRTVLNGGWTNYPVGNNYVQYNPDTNCGGTTVNIQNKATSALYRYTPYQPNQGALDAVWGQATCGAYGNRNFFMYFNEWFGNTTHDIKWEKMLSPRTMTVKQGTLKIDTGSLNTGGDWLENGTHITFETKTILIDGEVCLRTRYDTQNNINKCILLKRLKELDLDYKPIDINIYINTSTCKVGFLNVYADCNKSSLYKYQLIKIVAKTEFQGLEYFITKHDYDNNNIMGIRSDRVLTSSLEFNKIQPKYMIALKDLNIIVPETNEIVANVNKYQIVSVDATININNNTYYKYLNSNNESLYAIMNSNDLTDSYNDFVYPRYMLTNKLTKSINPFDNSVCQNNIQTNEKIYFNSKIYFNGVNYFRSKQATESGINCVITSSDLKEL